MAIKGLTDRGARFPVIGELRKGEKKTSESKPGKDLTYFRFTSEDTLAFSMFANAYPDQDALRNIHVFLPHKTAKENMDAWIEKWVAGGLIYRSDGETMVLWRTPTGAYSTEPKPDPRPEVGGDGKRKDGSGQVGRLSVIVPELGRFATVTVLTTSKHDIMNLTSQLEGYEALRGDLRGIPFILKRRLTKVSTPAPDGKRVRREKWLLSIETQPQWSMMQLGVMEQAALPTGEIIDVPALPPGEYKTIDIPAGVTNPFDDEPEMPEEPTVPAEPPQSEQPKPEPAQVNGGQTNGNGKLTRPMTPEQIKAAAEKRSARNTNPASETQLDYAASSLSKAVDGDDKKRHSITKYLFGFESLKNATAGQCSFIIDWIGAKKENEYAPEPDALKEVEMILRQFLVDAGQMEMALPETPAGDGGEWDKLVAETSQQPDPNNLDEWFPREPEEIDF